MVWLYCYQAVALFRSSAAAGAEYMAKALSLFGTEAPFFLARVTAIDLGEFLAFFWTFAPAASPARFVTRKDITLLFGGIVDVEGFRTDARHNLLPIDCFE